MFHQMCTRGWRTSLPVTSETHATTPHAVCRARNGVLPSLPSPAMRHPGSWFAPKSSRHQTVQSFCRAQQGGSGPRGPEDSTDSDTASTEPTDLAEEAEPTTSTSTGAFESIKEKLLDRVTIKERGDFVDVTMVCLAIAVYVYLSMQLWRVYALMVQLNDNPFQ